MNQPTPPTPNENAQIMIMFDVAVPSVIYRFNTAKKARKAYEGLVKAWKARSGWRYKFQPEAERKKEPPQHFEIKADMFDGGIDLDRVISVNIVEWPKRGKFVPREV